MSVMSLSVRVISGTGPGQFLSICHCLLEITKKVIGYFIVFAEILSAVSVSQQHQLN